MSRVNLFSRWLLVIPAFAVGALLVQAGGCGPMDNTNGSTNMNAGGNENGAMNENSGTMNENGGSMNENGDTMNENGGSMNENGGGGDMGDPMAGETVVADNCAVCHGADGASGFAPNIQGADVATITDRVTGGNGHPVYDVSEQDILDIEAYLASF